MRVLLFVLTTVFCLPGLADEAALRVKAVGQAPEGKTGPQAVLLARRGAQLAAKRSLYAALAAMADTEDTEWLREVLPEVQVDEGQPVDGGVEVTASLPWSDVVGALMGERDRADQQRARADALGRERDQLAADVTRLTEERDEAQGALAELKLRAEREPANPPGDDGGGAGLWPVLAVVALFAGAGAGLILGKR